MIHDIASDVRYAARTLRNARVVSTATVLTLGLGIGLLTAVFSIVNAAIIRPLPYDNAHRLVALGEDHPREYSTYSVMSPAAFEAVHERNRSFDAVAAYQVRSANIALGAATGADRITGVHVTADLFRVLRVRPFRGRVFTADEATEDAKVIVISYELWTTRLGTSDSVIGSTARIDGMAHTIVGVMGPGFNFPMREHYWRPLVWRAGSPEWLERSVAVAGRLRDGVTLEGARADVATIGASLARAHPATQEGWSLALRSEIIERRAIPGPLQWMVMGAGAFLMLIACANVTTVLLARAAGRRAEMAVRAALGASRARLVRQHITETMLLAVAGGVAGVVFATWMLDIAWAAVPTQNMPSWLDFGIDWRVLAFTTGISIVALLAVGVGPALTATRVQLSDSLKLGAAGETGSRRELRASRVLVIVEVAAAFVLFAGSALMLESFRSLQRIDFGLQAERVLVARPWLSASSYPTAERRATYFEAALDRVRRVPGIGPAAVRGDLDSLRGAAWTTDSFLPRAILVPLGGSQPDPSPRANAGVGRYVVTPEYFDAVKLPIVRGRVFTTRDDSGSTRVAVVGALVADRLWPNADAIGRQFRLAASGEWVTVVGVVGNVRLMIGGARGTRTRLQPAVYFPASQATSRNEQLVMHAADPTAVATVVARALLTVDPDQSLGRVSRLSDEMGSPRQQTLWIGVVFSVIAAGALVLASIGLCGVIAYSVARRTREIGVRMALGADARRLRWAVVRQGLRLTAIGLAIGVPVAWALARVTGAFLEGGSASLPGVYGLVAGVFLVFGAAASAVPARRATRVDPLVALRAQ